MGYDAPGQATLPGLGPLEPTDRLLLALLPPPVMARRLFGMGEALSRQEGLSGKPIGPERLHFTLYWFGDFAGGIPCDLLASAGTAAGRVRAAPFEVRVDHALSFEARHGAPAAVVLQDSAGAPAFRAFHEQLKTEMLNSGLKSRVGFNPHLTLLRDRRRIAPQPIEPLTWTATEFALVRSLLGRSRYEVLQTWPLNG